MRRIEHVVFLVNDAADERDESDLRTAGSQVDGQHVLIVAVGELAARRTSGRHQPTAGIAPGTS